MHEVERRRRTIDARQTDLARWSDPQQLEPAWDARAVAAAGMIAAGSRVIDIGCGAMALERHLPFGCAYQPCDVVTRDARTLVIDLNAGSIPPAVLAHADLAVMLGVWEYLYDHEAMFASLAAAGVPILCSYCDVTLTADRDRRRTLGWVNDLTLTEFQSVARAQGYRVALCRQIDPLQYLMRFEPMAPVEVSPTKRVHVTSYYNAGNFGDRLGYHLLNEVLPPHAILSWGTLRPLTSVPAGIDLLVVGIGNSLFGDLLGDQLLAAVDKAKVSIGIFGTQYRPPLPAQSLQRLLGHLTLWYARYEEDMLLYGRGRSNASHLGDWLINAFPLAVPTVDQTLKIGAGVLQDLPLDRTIQQIQRHKRIHSERLHPLLCGLASAEQAAYTEQRELGGTMTSGKFRSLLLDVFGEVYPENSLWTVDRARVAAYKAKVRHNTDEMRRRLTALLA